MNEKKQQPYRRGVTAVETLVSFTLLVTVISVTAPLMLRHNRLLADERAYRQAVDTLSNELDRLTILTGEELRDALDSLAADGPAGSRLKGSVESVDFGDRITLTIDWLDRSPRRPPLTLVGWSFVDATEREGGGLL